MRQHLWLGNERDAVHPAQRSAIEDMVVDLRDARLAPAGRDVARVEEKRAGGVILPRAVARDLRDRNGLVDRKSVVEGKSVLVRVTLGGRCIMKKTKPY